MASVIVDLMVNEVCWDSFRVVSFEVINLHERKTLKWLSSSHSLLDELAVILLHACTGFHTGLLC